MVVMPASVNAIHTALLVRMLTSSGLITYTIDHTKQCQSTGGVVSAYGVGDD